MEIPLGLVIPIVTAIVGGTSWNVSLQGRVNGHDKLFDEREKQANERHDDLKDRLERIETKLDRTLQAKR
jgi:hypothetical protein